MKYKTHIRECLLFKLNQGKNTKEATRLISKIYREDVLTERTSEWSFSKFREGLTKNSCSHDPFARQKMSSDIHKRQKMS